MIRIAFEFPGGRYHDTATPWSRQANGGAIEWPPSPWRVLQALVTTGYNKLGWLEAPEEARRLIEALSGRKPTYWLPPEITTGSSRRTAAKGDAKVGASAAGAPQPSGELPGNAVASVPRGRVALVAEWDVALEPSVHGLLVVLLSGATHLGPVEAGVALTLTDSVSADLRPCRPGDGPPDVGWERIELLSPMPEPQYQDWRATWLAIQSAKKTPPETTVEPAETMIDALRTAPAMLRVDGWSQPPGGRWVGFWRHPGAVVERPSKREPTLHGEETLPTTALLALVSDATSDNPLPRLTETLWHGEAIHAALLSIGADDEIHARAQAPVGGDLPGAPIGGHRHSFVLPLTLDGRCSHIDHVVVHSATGFDRAALQALRRLRRTLGEGLPRLQLTLVELGGARDVARLVRELGTAQVWESRTPFVPPRRVRSRGRDTLTGQVRAECNRLGLTPPSCVEIEIAGGATDAEGGQTQGKWLSARSYGDLRARLDGRPNGRDIDESLPSGARLAPRWRHYRRTSRAEAGRKPAQVALGLRLTFPRPVQGPVALGYGSQFGLGLMRPAREQP